MGIDNLPFLGPELYSPILGPDSREEQRQNGTEAEGSLFRGAAVLLLTIFAWERFRCVEGEQGLPSPSL